MNPEEIEDLDEIDKEILRLKYTNRKLSYRQIGQLLPDKLSLQSVHQRFKKPKVQKYWKILEQDVIAQIKEAQYKAVQVMLSTLNSPDQKLAFQAAKTILEPILTNYPDLLPKRVEEQIELEFYDDAKTLAETEETQAPETETEA